MKVGGQDLVEVGAVVTLVAAKRVWQAGLVWLAARKALQVAVWQFAFPERHRHPFQNLPLPQVVLKELDDKQKVCRNDKTRLFRQTFVFRRRLAFGVVSPRAEF